VVTGLTYMATLGAVIASGNTCTIAANYKDTSGLAATVAKVSATAVTDTTGPSVTAKLTKTVNGSAVTATMGTGGTWITKALSTGAYSGPAGNAWSVQLIAGTSTTAATVSLYDTVAKTIVVTACVATCATGYQATAQTIVNALNAHTAIAANFISTVIAGANSTAVHAATSLAGGTVVYDLVLTANEIMLDVATATGFDDAQFTHDADGAGVGTAGCTVSQDAADDLATPNTTDHYLKSMHITCTAAAVNQLMTTGISHIVSSANTKDFAGNAIPAAGRKIIVQAG
jgi:hypothetical protein